MITRVKYYKRFGHFWKWTYQPIFLRSCAPCLETKFLSLDKHPSFIVQITTLRFASACLDELRAFDVLHNVFALQPEVIIKTLREYLGDATNVTTEAPASSYGMYYWAQVPHVRYLIATYWFSRCLYLLHVNLKCILATFDIPQFKNTDLVFKCAPLRDLLALAQDCH